MLSSAAVLAVAASLASPVTPPVAAAVDETQHVGFHSWDSTAQLAYGRLDGAKVDHGRISMVRATGTTATPTRSGTARRGLRQATWTSPVVHAGFDSTELVASWNAETPAGTWVQVEMRGTTDAAPRQVVRARPLGRRRPGRRRHPPDVRPGAG